MQGKSSPHGARQDPTSETRERLQDLIEFVLTTVTRWALSAPDAKWRLTVNAKGADITWEFTRFGEV